MNVKDTTVLVTGANRGIGRRLVEALRDAGARKIYAAARDPAGVADLVATDPARVSAVALDITDPARVAAATRSCADVELLINNAGINFNTPLIAQDGIGNARAEMETNYLGTLSMCKAFAPVLGANGGGMIVNVLSLLARVSLPVMGSLCASKAAGLLMTLGVRAELAGQGTHVMAVMPGPVDTDMTPGGEARPEDVAAVIVAAIGDRVEELYPDPMARAVAARLDSDPKAVEKEFAAHLPD